MKKLLLILGLIFGSNGVLNALPVNECKIDVYFGNGVWNEPEDAEKSRRALEKRILNREIIKGDPALQAKYGKVKLQYNWGQSWDIDLVETFYQLKEAGQLSEWEFFALMDELLTKRAADITGDDVETMRNKLLVAITYNEQTNVREMLKKYYKESFQYSHRVLLVSHSQGNLFANRVYDSIDPSGYKAYFANVQVASPASSVHAQMGDYVTGWIDPIINPIPGSMESNADLDLPGGHAFVAAYLDSEDTYTKIVQAIRKQLENLDGVKSQWQTDQEIDKGTCDYRITVKHRFDPSLEIGEKVYPFAPNQKLYAATNQKSGTVEYVKATCGGTAFTDEWADKKENECWMINNEPKEKIMAKHCAFEVAVNDGAYTCYDTDTFFTYVHTTNYGAYTFHVHYDDVNTSWTACRHCTQGWTNSFGDRLEIGNGAGGGWIHQAINFYVHINQ